MAVIFGERKMPFLVRKKPATIFEKATAACKLGQNISFPKIF